MLVGKPFVEAQINIIKIFSSESGEQNPQLYKIFYHEISNRGI